MTRHLLSKIIALLLTSSLLLPATAFAQDASQQTRPRRVSAPAPEVSPPPAPEVNLTELETPEIFNPARAAARIDSEPTVRVALATNARAVVVSSSAGALLCASDVGQQPAPLSVARVRVEPRAYPPLLPAADGVDTRARTDEAADGKILRAGRTRDADNKRAVEAGSVRLASRVAATTIRGAAVYASGLTPLVEARAPLTFLSEDASQPLKFNEKPYRGSLEVFANTRGTLTVVNVVRLEDYVRGVVPNELSPGGYPALEALKAQAVAARTYAVGRRGQYDAEGYDLLPDTRSQVYRGSSTEHPLTDRAVAETRGRVLTYKGEVIDALYTSTCGGRTEDAEKIFGGAAPYLRARECAAEGRDAFEPFVVRTSRDPLRLREGAHSGSARDVALLLTHGFRLAAPKLDDEWLADPLTVEDARALIEGASLLSRQRRVPVATAETTRPPAFASALLEAVDGESRADVLLSGVDVSYLLAFRDADEIPARHRADVALLVRDGHLSLNTDATLRPRQPLSRARALRTTARLLEARGLLRLQKATARPSAAGALVLRPASGKGADRALAVSDEAYLFRAFGDELFPVREVALVGGEPIAYHTNARGEADYLEVRPAPNGASAERFSPFTNWTVTLTPGEVAARLARWTKQSGSLVDLRVAARGASRRVIDLEVVGTRGSAHVLGGRVRSALGLREQLFVIERRYDDDGRIDAYVFKGRGWGHGVGLCQVGAYGLARAGHSYEKILDSYYTGVELTKLY